MPQMTIEVPHSLPPEEALRRVKRALEELRQTHSAHITSLREEWSGTTGQFELGVMGMKSTGSIAVTATNVRFDAHLPLAALFLRSRIEYAIRETAERVLHEPSA